MEFNGIKIPTNDKKVAITPNHGDATVRLKKEDVIIIFDEKYFILWKNEFVRVAIKILEQVFEGYFDFKISTNMTGALYARFSLKGGENYEVSCQRYYTFIDIVSQISMPLPMDYFVTAEKAQKTLSNLKLGDEKQYEKIIIYDNNKQQIDDKNFQLKNLSNPKLYFSVGPNQKSSVATTQNINKLTTQHLDSPPVGYQQPGSTQPKAPFVYYPKLDELKSPDNGTKQSSFNSNEENQSPLLRYNTGTKLVIHFICEESVGKKFESFDERIASNMTIGELSNFISNKYGIQGELSSPIQLEQLNTKQENNLSVLTKYLARLISGYLFIGEYQEAFHQILGKIGEGATSCTYIVFDKRINKMICKKVIKIKDGKEFKTARNAVKEFEVMHSLDHPCICKAIGYNTSEKVEEGVTAVAIFMEYLEHN